MQASQIYLADISQLLLEGIICVSVGVCAWHPPGSLFHWELKFAAGERACHDKGNV